MMGAPLPAMPLPAVRIDGVPHVVERVAIAELEAWRKRHRLVPVGHIEVEGAWPPFVIYERRPDGQDMERGGS